jgi:hypothetical protein
MLFTFTLLGCATPITPTSETTVLAPVSNSDSIESLRKSIRQLDYFINHDKCFISYAVCLGEKKNQKTCFKTHEACVIAVYKQFKGVK